MTRITPNLWFNETGALVTVDPVEHRVTVLPISMGGAWVRAQGA